MKIELGSQVKDPITGLSGTVMGRTEYLTGCAHVGIQQKMDKDGKVPDWEWIDERRCILIKAGEAWEIDSLVAEIKKDNIAKEDYAVAGDKGGPQLNAPQM